MMRAWLAAVVALSLFVAAVARAAPDGTPCTAVGDCDSGFCADGVCCDRACDGTCEACVASLKQGGLNTGTCGPIRAGTDPRNECTASVVTTCGQTGSCNGLQAACALWPLGTPCHDPADTECLCNTNNVTGWICSGSGGCYHETGYVQCGSGENVCALTSPADAGSTCSTPAPGACRSPCTADTDCLRGARCLAGACVSRLPGQAACTSNLDCANGHCADGLCCDTACNRQCEACNLPGLVGTCSQVTGQPVPGVGPDFRQDCAGIGTACYGTCRGARDGCDYPDRATTCGAAAACVNDSVKLADTCDGTGLCKPGATTDCGEYTCDPANAVCFTSCTTQLECAGTDACDTSSGRGTCNPATTTCVDAWSSKTVDGVTTSCKGFACVAGACQQKCGGPGDCDAASGYTCNAAHRCVLAGADAGTGGTTGAGGTPGAGGTSVVDAGSKAPDSGSAGVKSPAGPSASHDAGGCGCRAARGDRSSPLAVALGIVGSLFLRRRVAAG